MGQHQTAIGLNSLKKVDWSGKRVLDIGCGDGKLSLEVIKRTKARELIGIDADKSEIDKAKLIKDTRASFYVSDASNLPFEDESFDAIFCNIAFQQFKEKEKALQEMYRVLKNKGEVIINFIEEKSEVLQAMTKILKGSFNIDINKKSSKIYWQEFEELAKKAGFKIKKSVSKEDTYFFKDVDLFFWGYKQTIDSKTDKFLSKEEKARFIGLLTEHFMDKKTEEGIPDTWHIVNAALIKMA